VRLLKDEEIKVFRRQAFSGTNSFLQKLMNISDLFTAKFVRHYEGYILRRLHLEFQSFALNLNEQRASEKKGFFSVFYFFSTKLIL